MLVAIDKPSPVPPVCLFLDVSSLWKGLKAYSLLSKLIPGPSSSMHTIKVSSAVFSIISELFAYRIALDKILVIALLNNPSQLY